ncbi:class I SAM-dependent methyltransferase [Luteimicrobium subarcticum]|uniref:Methyltransferase family protein n=1 Tax=Luteimicrobium subarcticum TaxID=620910 RepID=A0A2M8WUQ4_9MICO|nr:class I SAM-dependent methyltransferase [Luteimicrobium subarcticum]PJI94644.1 methyltransferase family protein [Luteimicrobium subarcticum]
MSETSADLRAAVYDAVNVWAPDDDYFLARAAEGPGIRVLDLGCGTGRLTTELARTGFEVTGVDPDGEALEAARRKPGGDLVRWVEGTSEALGPDLRFDVVIMTAHVVQAIADDGEWRATLADVHRALVSGGLLTFDSRDPAAGAWERWTPDASRSSLTLPDGTVVEGWYEVTGTEPATDGADHVAVVHLTDHTLLPDGTHTVETGDLAFRSEQRLRDDVTAAGFVVRSVVGGWAGQPVGAGDGELIVVALRP